MTINRVWSMPNKWTFKIPPIMNLVHKYAGDGKGWVDPFAGCSEFAERRNDLNPLMQQPYHMEAADFLKELGRCGYYCDESIGHVDHKEILGVIFDPPYSLTQVSRSYEEMGYKFKGKEDPTGGFTKVRDEIARLVPIGGHVISFGWNTVGMGKGRGFEITEILIVCHGGNRNDTLCTVEKRI
jgi:hypothetical protein